MPAGSVTQVGKSGCYAHASIAPLQTGVVYARRHRHKPRSPRLIDRAHRRCTYARHTRHSSRSDEQGCSPNCTTRTKMSWVRAGGWTLPVDLRENPGDIICSGPCSRPDNPACLFCPRASRHVVEWCGFILWKQLCALIWWVVWVVFNILPTGGVE